MVRQLYYLLTSLLLSLSARALARPPANDRPANSTLLKLNQPIAGTTRNATSIGSPALPPVGGCDRRSLPDVWYSYSPPWGQYSPFPHLLLRIRCTAPQLVRVGRLLRTLQGFPPMRYPFRIDTCVLIYPAQGPVELRLALDLDASIASRSYDISVSSLQKGGGDFTLEVAHDPALMPCAPPAFTSEIKYSTHTLKRREQPKRHKYKRFKQVIVRLDKLPAGAPPLTSSRAGAVKWC